VIAIHGPEGEAREVALLALDGRERRDRTLSDLRARELGVLMSMSIARRLYASITVW
jgi:hypothetical protein